MYTKPIYLCRNKTFNDLKEKLLKIINLNQNSLIEKKDFRLWKMTSKLYNLKNIIRQNQEEILTNVLVKFSDLHLMECNYL